MRRYNLTAKMYDTRYCEEQEAKYEAALEDLSLSKDNVVLDAGCGSGMFFSQVAGAVGAVVGVDVSLELLLLAKANAKPLGNVFLVLADADHLPFGPQCFDLIFVFTVLQNMPNPAETLTELKRCANPDASFVVTGLKVAVSLEKFGRLLNKAGLQATSLRDDEDLKCHVIRASAKRG